MLGFCSPTAAMAFGATMNDKQCSADTIIFLDAVTGMAVEMQITEKGRKKSSKQASNFNVLEL